MEETSAEPDLGLVQLGYRRERSHWFARADCGARRQFGAEGEGPHDGDHA
ncbi:MAG: hypothetical protein SV862_16225 [Pseudomonadota bacterium]|nr:hypothetical protein [Pseudomonadota bacterium]